MPNVGAEFTASIVIDKNDLITQALKQLSTAQKELEKNKLEIYFDLSNADLSKKLKKYQKQLSSTDYTIKINNKGIEETYKSLDKLLDIVKTIASGKEFGTGFGNINADNAIKQIDKLENRISELTKEYDELQKKSSSATSVSATKDTFKVENQTDIKAEATAIEQVEKATDEAVQSKKDFITANKGVQDSVADSKSPLQLEAELMNQIAKSAKEAANAKKEFVEENKLVEKSVDDGHSVTNAIKEENNALEQNTQKAKENAEAIEKQIQKNRKLALSYTKAASNKLSNAISKYSYGDTSKATSMMKQMNIGVSNFKDFPNNIDERIIELDSIIENIIAKLRRSHEENLRSLNAEIQAEETIQKQKDAFDKSNLNTIDLEIKKREEEGKRFSKSLKSKMEQQSQFNKQLEKINSIINTHNEHLQDYQSQSKKKNFVPTTNFLHNISNYETVFKDLQNFAKQISQQDFITDEQLQRFEELKKECKEAYDVLKNMKSSDKGANFVSIQKLIDRICSDLKKNTKYSTEAKQKIEEYLQVLNSGNVSDTTFNEILAGWLKITNAEKLAGRAGKSFFDILNDSRVHQIAAQIAGMFSFYDVINIGKQAVSTVIDLNTQITELAKVSEQSGRQIYADFDSYADIAKEVRGTISDTISATADWSKNGYNIPAAKQLAEVSQLYRNVGDGIDIDSANESLISTLKGFQLEADQAEHIVDVFNEVSNNEAISSAGIGNALQRSAASFNAANTSLEKSVSLVTATNSILQDPEKVGNMWRTVSARLRGSKTELIEMGEDTEGIIESKSKLQSLVKGITGFDIMKDKDTYKDIYDIVLGIGEKWQDISDIDRASLLEALAGLTYEFARIYRNINYRIYLTARVA